MNRAYFEEFMADYFANTIQPLLGSKGKEYSGDADIFKSARTLSEQTGMSVVQIHVTFLMKHIHSIASWLKNGHTLSESIEGRIDDSIGYLLLLRALLTEIDYSSTKEKSEDDIPF